jgi:hypothetical protein
MQAQTALCRNGQSVCLTITAILQTTIIPAYDRRWIHIPVEIQSPKLEMPINKIL